MRGLTVTGTVLAASLVWAGLLPARAGQEDALRWVEVQPKPGEQAAALAALKALGFEPADGPAVKLSGRLPQKALAAAAQLPSVRRIVCGPTTAKEPPARTPAYAVRLRFRIDSSVTQRHAFYKEMLRSLEAAGFKKDPGLEGEWRYSNVCTGTVPAAGVDRVVNAPYVRTAVLIPAGYELPAEPTQTVLVRIDLSTAAGAAYQPDVAQKTLALLRPLGFHEAVGYEDASLRTLMGRLPVGQLNALLDEKMAVDVTPVAGKDRFDPTLPTIRLIPLRRVEVIRDEPAAPAAPAEGGKDAAKDEGKDSGGEDKVAPDLRKLLAQGNPDKPVRVEVVLRDIPPPGDRGWQNLLEAASLAPEGRLGPVVTGSVPASQVDAIAALPTVSTVRLPVRSRPWTFPPFDPKDPTALAIDFVPLARREQGAGDLPALVRRRANERAAVIAGDFRGYQQFLGKGLPAKTQLFDFTGQANRDLEPAADSGDPQAVGTGTRIALALAATAPLGELYLLRVDPAAPYQVEQIARAVAGVGWRSAGIFERERELAVERQQIDDRRTELRIKRRTTLDNYGDDEDARAVRQQYRKLQQEFDRDEALHRDRVARYMTLVEHANRLKGLDMVVLGLCWCEGHPFLPGEQPVIRNLDPAWLQASAWLQAVPRLRGQVWSGAFRDQDRDGVMEFTAAETATAGRPELNFLAWQPLPWGEAPVRSEKLLWEELPAGAVVQVTVQWREVHDPEWKRNTPTDDYRKPLADLHLTVLRQRDPTAQKLPPDAFEVVARSTALPDRIENGPRYAIYQATVRFQVPEQPGRYAVRLEGRHPGTTLPPTAIKKPGGESWDLVPKLFVDVLDPATRAKGTVLFQDHATPQ
jgi:hypothetical protein